jgi:hypothetical protein
MAAHVHFPTCASLIMTDEEVAPWLKRYLKVLEHPDPSSLLPCLHCTVSKEADICLHKLVLWLEVNRICQWDALQRRHSGLTSFFRKQEQQKEMFASSDVLQNYLSDCACPQQYTRQVSENPWYYEPNQRRRVLHWIVSRAISKMYHRERAITSRRQTHMDSINANFVTGNNVLDKHLMHLQLKYFSKLRCIQDESNRLIGEMQRLAIEAASNKKGQRKSKEKER